MKGQHDDHLQWPFTGTIIIELLNWLEDKGHYKKYSYNWYEQKAKQVTSRVTKGEYGNQVVVILSVHLPVLSQLIH